MTTLAENSLFAGRYRVVRCIAAGGMGAIYEVVHLETDRRRALKVMLPSLVHSAELRERFKGEARVAARIDSDYIVDVFDAGIDEATTMPFLVMELLKGEELGKRLERHGKFAPFEALNFLWQTALALDKTHKANIVHRDLKPENLFLNERDDGPPRVKVLDFGVAKFVAEAGTQANATRSVGTPLYMAPEQFRGHNVTSGCDNYALAMMAYTMLVGHAYWSEEAESESNVFGFALRVQSGPVVPASTRAAQRGVALSADFDRWFLKAAHVNPAERFPSATASINALGQVLGINPARLVGVAASDPIGGAGFSPNQSAPGFSPNQSGPGFSPNQSGGAFVGPQGARPSWVGSSGAQGGTNASGVTVTQPPKSRAGAFAVLGVVAVVVCGGAAIGFSVLRHGSSASEPTTSATPLVDTAPSASAQATASASPTATATPLTPDPTASAAASAAPSAVPAADSAGVSAEPSTPAPQAAHPGGRGKLPPPKPSATPVAKPTPPPTPTPPPAGKPTYTRD